MFKSLTLYERFVLIVRSNNLVEARKLAGDNVLLQEVVTYLTQSYELYKKTQN